MANPVWSQTRIMISAKTLIGLVVNQGMGSPPSATTMAFRSPICGEPAGCQAYMKPQMTEAPTSEIASGRNTKVLASASRLTRSNSPAIRRPSSTLAPVPKISHRALLRRIVRNSGSVSTAKFESVNWPSLSWNARRIVPAAG